MSYGRSFVTSSTSNISSNGNRNSNYNNNTRYEQPPQQQQQQQQRIQKNLSSFESESSSRPLSLYDNLSALVASLKPPHLSDNNYYNNSGQQQQQYHHQQSETFLSDNCGSGSNNNNSLINVKQEDFAFSDISFSFPEISINSQNNNSFINYNNESVMNGKQLQQSERNFNNKMNTNQRPLSSSTSTQAGVAAPVPAPPIHQYVNIDESFNRKPVISDAKSSFFGLNGNTNLNNNNRLLNNDHHDDHDSSLHPLLNTSSNGNTTIGSLQSSNTRNYSDNLSHNNSRNSELNQQQNQQNQQSKTVTYVTPEYESQADKPSQVSFYIKFWVFYIVEILKILNSTLYYFLIKHMKKKKKYDVR